MILHQLVYTLPELSLLMGIVHLGILYMLSYESARLYARVSRFWLLASIFWNIVFYDKTFSPLYFANDAYTLLFSLLAGFLAYIMLGLSSAWFSVENRTGCRYYVLVLCALIGIDLLLAASNLVALLFCYILLIFINYRLLGISYEKLPSEAAVRYMGVSAVIVLIFAAGFGFLNYIQDGAVDFSELYALFSGNTASLPLFLAAVAIVVPFLYSLGIAPFHIMAEDKAGRGILPVSHYFALVAPVALWGAFIKLNIELLAPYKAALAPVYVGFALLSAVFGAVGANARINLHRIMSYSSMYHFGVVLLLLSFFRIETDFAAFVYLFVLYAEPERRLSGFLQPEKSWRVFGGNNIFVRSCRNPPVYNRSASGQPVFHDRAASVGRVYGAAWRCFRTSEKWLLCQLGDYFAFSSRSGESLFGNHKNRLF